MNVLVTGVGFGSVGESILNSIEDDVFACDTDYRAASLHLTESFIVPYAKSEQYIYSILGICKVHDIELVIPGTEIELDVLSSARALLNQHGIKVLMNSYDLIKTFSDKWESFIHLAEERIHTPVTFLGPFTLDYPYPMIVKPRKGHGSAGVKVYNENIPKLSSDWIAQEYLEGDEYTCACVSDLKGNLKHVFIGKHMMIDGSPWWLKPIKDSSIEKYIRSVATILRSTGPMNIQFKLVNGKPVIFEINPRLSGSASMRKKLGFNDVNYCIELYKKSPRFPDMAVDYNRECSRMLRDVSWSI